MSKKIVVIGLDGATLDLIYPWIDAGYLPNLGRTRSLRPPLARNPSVLAGFLDSLLSDPNLRREMGQAARARVERLFTLERYVQQLEAAYREVM